MAEIYKLVHSMKFLGQECQNRYNYVTLGSEGNAKELAELWAEFFAPAVAQVQVTTVQHVSVEVDCLTQPDDAHVVYFTDLTGVRNGQGMPPHDAYGLTFPVQTSATRSGAKRIVGISELDTNDGTIDSVWKSILDGIAQVLASYIAGAIEEYLPIILRDLGNSWGLNAITDGTFKRITTQNTRKFYKGGGEATQIGRGTTSELNVTGYTSTPTGVLAGMSGAPRDATTFFTFGWPVGQFKPSDPIWNDPPTTGSP